MQKKCEKNEADELGKVKKYMEKGDAETARIHAQNAIRMKNEGVGYLKLASRLDAVASRVQSGMAMQMVAKDMAAVTKGMDKAMKSMDVNKITAIMDKFEQSFDQMDVQSQYVEGAMAGATATTMPEDQVEMLMQQVSDEHGLEFKMSAADAGRAPVEQQTAALGDSGEEGLEQRLAALRG